MTRVLACLGLALAACGGDDDGGGGGGGRACADGAHTLAITRPAEGAAITMADDFDPVMTGLQYEVMVRQCGYTIDDQVGLYLLEPVESPYGYAQADSDVLVIQVPLLPGAGRMQARDTDMTVTSAVVSYTVTLD